MKKRLQLSLLALVGSVLLFVVTSLAWFSISDMVNIGIFQGRVSGADMDYTFYVSEDGTTYTETTSIDFQLSSPGDTIYYRIYISNPQDGDFNVNVYLTGINDIMTDGSTYNEIVSLTEVTQLTSEMDSVVLVDDTLENLMSAGLVSITENFVIDGNGSKTIDFSLTILGSANNQYQNLGLEIDFIRIYFDNE